LVHHEPQPRHALIIGGGIGGLATAIALRRAGIQATVYERADEIRAIGAGLALWANAVRALGRLGLPDAMRAIGVPEASAAIYSWRGGADPDVVARPGA
jgi:2-polyprenyl-6-methoxyphenol hydroxylase-like FAD-dependent oxidoreductase